MFKCSSEGGFKAVVRAISRQAMGVSQQVSVEQPSVAGWSDLSRGSPTECQSFKAELAGKNVQGTPEVVCRHIEALIKAKGQRLAEDLPLPYRKHLDGAVDAYRQAGYNEPTLAALRLAVAQKLRDILPPSGG